MSGVLPASDLDAIDKLFWRRRTNRLGPPKNKIPDGSVVGLNRYGQQFPFTFTTDPCLRNESGETAGLAIIGVDIGFIHPFANHTRISHDLDRERFVYAAGLPVTSFPPFADHANRFFAIDNASSLTDVFYVKRARHTWSRDDGYQLAVSFINYVGSGSVV